MIKESLVRNCLVLLDKEFYVTEGEYVEVDAPLMEITLKEDVDE